MSKPITFNGWPVKVIACVFNIVAIEISLEGGAKQILWVRPEWLENLPTQKDYREAGDDTVIFDGTFS